MLRSGFVLALSLGSLAQGQQTADLVLYNGTVLTVDSQDRVAQAVAVRGSRIVAVGSDDEILKLAGDRTRRIDLRGRTVTPGLMDAHAHFSGGAANQGVLDLSYPRVTSIADVRDSISARATSLPADGWISGRGWDEGKFREARFPSASDLDGVTGGRPVWLMHTTGHYGVANTEALRRAGITRETRDPPGGTIDRAPDGTPTGVLKESAMGLVSGLVPRGTRSQLESGMAILARQFNAEGMTGVKDPGIGPETFEAYRAVQARGELPLRVFALWQGGRTVESAQRVAELIRPFTHPNTSTGDDHLISGGVKLFLDGSGGARTAWLHEDWSKEYQGVDAGNTGYPTTDPAIVRQQIRLLHDAGLHVSVHSIGDRAIDWTVDSYAEALRGNPRTGLRHGIIHANIPTDRAMDVMADLQRRHDAAIPEPSATFLWWIGDTYSSNFGVQRSLRLNPFRTFQRRGIRWANGSDFSVTPFPARYGIWAAVARAPLMGTNGPAPFGSEEAVDARSALRAVTIEVARQMFLEQKVGSVEVGKYADLAVWDRNPYAVSTAQLKDMKCELTLFNGRVVFDRASATSQDR
jgi:predicted amidohydrolase YtcJ